MRSGLFSPEVPTIAGAVTRWAPASMRSGLFSPEVHAANVDSRTVRDGFNEVRAIQPGSTAAVVSLTMFPGRFVLQ